MQFNYLVLHTLVVIGLKTAQNAYTLALEHVYFFLTHLPAVIFDKIKESISHGLLSMISLRL